MSQNLGFTFRKRNYLNNMGERNSQTVVRIQRAALSKISTEHVVADTNQQWIYQNDADEIS